MVICLLLDPLRRSPAPARPAAASTSSSHPDPPLGLGPGLGLPYPPGTAPRQHRSSGSSSTWGSPQAVAGQAGEIGSWAGDVDGSVASTSTSGGAGPSTSNGAGSSDALVPSVLGLPYCLSQDLLDLFDADAKRVLRQVCR